MTFFLLVFLYKTLITEMLLLNWSAYCEEASDTFPHVQLPGDLSNKGLLIKVPKLNHLIQLLINLVILSGLLNTEAIRQHMSIAVLFYFILTYTRGVVMFHILKQTTWLGRCSFPVPPVSLKNQNVSPTVEFNLN